MIRLIVVCARRSHGGMPPGLIQGETKFQSGNRVELKLGNGRRSERWLIGASVEHQTKSDIVSFELTPWPSPSFAPLPTSVPYYLSAHYWWAYVHPRAVQVFERQWLLNLILWGNSPRLSESALDELGDELPGAPLAGA